MFESTVLILLYAFAAVIIGIPLTMTAFVGFAPVGF
jgi:hypothetical protein